MIGHPEPVLAGVPLADARMVGVLVHGRDQDEQVMLDVADRLALSDVGYVLPVAADGRWYAGRYFDPLPVNEPELLSALDAIEAGIDLARAAGIADERIVVGGFSQGACLTAELIARRPHAYAGAAVLTGTLLGRPGEEATPPPLNGLPMFFGFSRHDDWIAPERAHATARIFTDAGARTTVEVYDDTEHVVTDAAVAGLRRLFHRGI